MAYSPNSPPKRHAQRLRRIRRNRFWLLLYLWVAGAWPEVILHCASASSPGALFSPGMLLGPLFAGTGAIFLFILCTSFPSPGVNFGLCLGYSLWNFLLCGAQIVYYRIMGNFFSVCSLFRGIRALGFTDTVFSGILHSLPLRAAMAAPILVLILLGRRLFSFRPLSALRRQIPMVIVCGVLHGLLVLSLPLFGGTGDLSPYGLYHRNSDSYSSVNSLGVSTAMGLDLWRYCTGTEVTGTVVLSQPPVETRPLPSAPSALPVPEDKEKPPLSGPWQDNVLSIDFQALAASESRDEIREVHQYFASREASAQNEKTGLFRGCNLILITAESFSPLAVDPERTPTLYKLMTEGFSFTNYYVPDWGVSTTDGEYAHLTGTIPKSGAWSFSQSSENYMPLTMAQQLIRLGYSAYAYHPHDYDYYGRDAYLENLGYEYKALGSGLAVAEQWPESDVEMVDLSVGEYLRDTPFTVYYMTVSGHREYAFSTNAMAAKHAAAVSGTGFSEEVQAYLACQLELEEALSLLLRRLEAAGVLEDTVIVLTADHYPSGLSEEALAELLGHAPGSDFERYRSGLILWKAGLTPETIDSPMSHLDLLPTLSNLFGLEFDTRLYMGRDVFSNAPSLVVLRNRSWMTDIATYNAETGEVISRTGEPVPKSYVNEINAEVNNRFTVSARIVQYDYWRILFGDP